MKIQTTEELWSAVQCAPQDKSNSQTPSTPAIGTDTAASDISGPVTSPQNVAVETTSESQEKVIQAVDADRAAVKQNQEALGHASKDAFPQAIRLDVMSFPDQPAVGSQRLPITLDNVEHLLRGNNVSTYYDVIKKRTVVHVPGHRGTSDNMDNSVMAYLQSLASLNGMNRGALMEMVNYIADRNARNPVAKWIVDKPWDGRSRMAEFLATIVTIQDYPPGLKDTLLKKWALSAVAAALKPTGFKCRGVLTLQGPQNIGKTSWGMALVNDPVLREQVIKVDHHLDGSNKDSILGAVSHWIVEIGELDSSFKKDIARLKGFLTSDFDKIRRPYARAESEYQRRTVFFATVNDHNFLVDQTGNSRWWTIAVKSLNYQHKLDMQQVFAELAIDFYAGEQWWLTPDEEETLDLYNRNHRNVSVIRELLEEHIDLNRKHEDGLPAMTPIKVLKMVGVDRPTNPQCKECSSILREWFGAPKRIRGEWKFRIPVRKNDSAPRAIVTVNLDDDDKY
jgi:putative DNA primase/helicase